MLSLKTCLIFQVVKRTSVNDLEGIEKLEFLQNVLASDSKIVGKTQHETGKNS